MARRAGREREKEKARTCGKRSRWDERTDGWMNGDNRTVSIGRASEYGNSESRFFFLAEKIFQKSFRLIPFFFPTGHPRLRCDSTSTTTSSTSMTAPSSDDPLPVEKKKVDDFLPCAQGELPCFPFSITRESLPCVGINSLVTHTHRHRPSHGDGVVETRGGRVALAEAADSNKSGRAYDDQSGLFKKKANM